MRALALISLALGFSACASTAEDLQITGKFLSLDTVDLPCHHGLCIEGATLAEFKPTDSNDSLSVVNTFCENVMLNTQSYGIVLSSLYDKPVIIRSNQTSDVTYKVQYNVMDCQPIGQI